MKNYMTVIILLSCILIGTACSKSPEKKPEPPGPKIGVQLSLVEKDIAEIIKKNMQNAAKEKKLQLIWNEPAQDYLTLEKNIRDLIKQKVKVVIIQFMPGELSLDLARQVLEKDIKLFAIGTLPFDVPLDGFIAPDSFRLGQLQSQYVVNELRKQGLDKAKVILYELDQRDYAFSQMTAGVLSILQPAQGITLDRREIKINELSTASSKIESELLAEKNYQAVILQSSSLAAEISQTLKSLVNTDIITVGLGAGKEASTLIAGGIHDAEADPMPEMVARVSIQAAAQAAKNESWQYDTQIASGSYDIPAKILPVRLIKQDNLFLLKDRWGKLTPKQKEAGTSKKQGSQGGEEKKSQGQQKKSEGESGSKGKMKLKIKTKNGQTLEIDLPGEIEQMEVKKAEEKEKQGGGEQKGGGGQ
ncbi:MAG: hypothetical protein PWQ96_198 [Clostridia bacterium]|nr:hypothetical protein [Clostridia bacterium]